MNGLHSGYRVAASAQEREAADWLHVVSWRAGTAATKCIENDPSRPIFDRARLSPVVYAPRLTPLAQNGAETELVVMRTAC